jgi:hypothetical protein
MLRHAPLSKCHAEAASCKNRIPDLTSVATDVVSASRIWHFEVSRK